MTKHTIQEHIKEIQKSKDLVEKNAICQGSKDIFLEHPLSVYLEFLAKELKTSKKVTSHSVLKSEKWTKSCYDLLSKKITADLIRNLSPELRVKMGASLSSKTLQKIITRSYHIAYPIDPRTLNTLNKIVMFLEYKNWDDFVMIRTQNHSETLPLETISEEDLIKGTVEEAIRHEHLAYCALPEIKVEHLNKNFIKNSSSYNMIMDALIDKGRKKQTISNNYNPSTFEILEIEVKKIENRYAQVFTKEYWLLCWWDSSQKRYVKRFKEIADHIYILEKINNVWMIKTNASTSDPMELD